jgi:hypothetical protein
MKGEEPLPQKSHAKPQSRLRPIPLRQPPDYVGQRRKGSEEILEVKPNDLKSKTQNL